MCNKNFCFKNGRGHFFHHINDRRQKWLQTGLCVCVCLTPCVLECFHTEQTATGCRRLRLEEIYQTHTHTELIYSHYTLLSSPTVLVVDTVFSSENTQTQWPRSGPADRQKTGTLLDCRRDPPELETSIPAAHLETETQVTGLEQCTQRASCNQVITQTLKTFSHCGNLILSITWISKNLKDFCSLRRWPQLVLLQLL